MMNMINHGEKHIPCVLLVDISGSMEGLPMQELNEGLRLFGEALQEDSKAYGCADICVISFDSSAELVLPFSPAADYHVPQLKSGGLTSMNEAIIGALELIEQRKQEYKTVGVSYWRPWLFLLTDGVPTDTYYSNEAHTKLQEALASKKVIFFPMAIGPEADIATLRSYTKDGKGMVLKASKYDFKEAFLWLSSSMSTLSHSDPQLDTFQMTVTPPCITIDI